MPVSRQAFEQENAPPRARLKAIAQATGAQLIEPFDSLCRAGLCPVLDAQGVPLYTDSVHMRPEYSRRAAAYLEPTILAPAAAAASQLKPKEGVALPKSS